MISVQENISERVFEEMLNRSDLRLFEKITSQTDEFDKRSLLACQRAARNLLGNYVYLEIGSYLGGSIQPFLLDPACETIFSLDKRPFSQPDERGVDFVYKNNSTARMLENLKQVAPRNLDKIVCIDGDVSEIDKTKITGKPDLCFIDGEHTDAACRRDFHFCLEAMNRERGAIVFHDAGVIYHGLKEIVGFLEAKEIKFTAYNLPHVMFVIEIGDFPLHREAEINRMLINNHVGYLYSLQSNDFYRSFVNKPIIRKYREFRSWLAGSNVSE
jgi:hypothetical protein